MPETPPRRPSAPPIELLSGRRPASRLERIYLDPGHGGEELGALGPDGSQEKWIALDISLRLEALLLERGFEVVLSRRDDRTVPLRTRGIESNLVAADLAISIHANAGHRRARGIEVFTLRQEGEDARERLARQEGELAGPGAEQEDVFLAELAVQGNAARGALLARALQTALLDTLRDSYGREAIADRGVRRALFYLVIGPEVPSALVEAGFMSHRHEQRRLRTPRYRQLVAEGIYEGILEYAALTQAELP